MSKPIRSCTVSLAVFACLVLHARLTHDCAAQERAVENLTQGKTCRFAPKPNYQYCTDSDDPSQLTDGVTTEDYFWTQPGTVGWSGAAFATVAVDLGQVEPIGSVSLRTAAGRAGVTWPMAVYVLVSDDGATYRLAADLVASYHEQRGALPDDYAIRRLADDNLATRGRFVQFVLVPMPGGNFLFVDEVEVLRGEDRSLSEPTVGRIVENATTLFQESRLQRSILRRVNDDIRSVRTMLSSLDLNDTLQKQLVAELDDASAQFEMHTPVGRESFRALLPIGEVHARVFAIQAKAWKALGHRDLTVSAASPWDPLDPFARPDSDVGSIHVHTMGGEARSAAFNLANLIGEFMIGPSRLRRSSDRAGEIAGQTHFRQGKDLDAFPRASSDRLDHPPQVLGLSLIATAMIAHLPDGDCDRSGVGLAQGVRQSLVTVLAAQLEQLVVLWADVANDRRLAILPADLVGVVEGRPIRRSGCRSRLVPRQASRRSHGSGSEGQKPTSSRVVRHVG